MRIKPYLLALCLFATAARAGVDGSFIQLTRDKAERGTEAWREDFRRLKSLGGSLVIVQWTAEEPVLYFHSATPLPGLTEERPVVERILEAAEAEGLGVVLGLQHQPAYWRQLESRDKVLRDFFRVRLSRNERLQRALLEAFAQTSAPDQPFAAVPAPSERLRQQIEAARPHYQQLILYTYQDYLGPELGPEAAAGFQSLQASP